MGLSNFNKECIRCHIVKHIDEYRRYKKVNRVCNDCGEYQGKKVCPKCNIKKLMNEFQRHSQNNINCNACAKSADNFINEAFNNAFKLFNNSVKELKGVHPNKQV